MSSTLPVALSLALSRRRLRSPSFWLAVAGGILCGAAVAFALAGGSLIIATEADGAPGEETRMVYVFATALLLAPALLMIVTLARLSSGVQDRRLHALRVMGVGAGVTRVMAAVESAIPISAGVACGLLLQAGAAHSILPALALDGNEASAAAAIALGVTWAASAAGSRRGAGRLSEPGRARWLGLAALACGPMLMLGRSQDVIWWVAGVLVTLLAIAAATPAVVSWLGCALAAAGPGASSVLAGRWLARQPAGTARALAASSALAFSAIVVQSVLTIEIHDPSRDVIAAQRALAEGPMIVRVLVTPQQHEAVRALPEVRRTAQGPVSACPVGGGAGECLEVYLGTCEELLVASGGHITDCPDEPAWIGNAASIGIAAGKPYRFASGEQIFLPVPAADARFADPFVLNVRAGLYLPEGTPGIGDLDRARLGGPEPVWHMYEISPGWDSYARFRQEVSAALGPGFPAGYLTAFENLEGASDQDRRDAFLTAAFLALLLVAITALVVGSIDRAIDRSPMVKRLDVLGMGNRTLVTATAASGLAPLAVGIALAVALGLMARSTYLAGARVGGIPPTTGIVETTAITAGLCAAVILAGAFLTVAFSRRQEPTSTD